MRNINIIIYTLIILSSQKLLSQTDEDVIRYSNITDGGTSRFIGLSGAMGALGGDISCASSNPAGLGIMLRSDLNFSFGLNFANTITQFNNNTSKLFSPALTFNFLGISGTSVDKKNVNNRYTLAITLNQLQNFNQEIEIKGRATKGKSLTLDMLDYAKGTSYQNLDYTYEGAAYYTYLIDLLDTNNLNSYFSYIDTSKSFLQQNKISKSGRINELNFSFAYSINDDVYLGISMGIPFLKFAYNSDYAEIDDENQMYIIKNPDNTFSSSYPYAVNYYQEHGGIKDFHYQTTYTTTATGFNIKLGGIWRAANFLRIGLYYQSPTWYKAKDVYYYMLTTNWDEGKTITTQQPENGGIYNYRIITPSKASIAVSNIIKNMMSINAEYQLINYGAGLLKSTDIGVFDNANKAIKEKYKFTGNLKCGIELNTKPIIFRIGWASYGSPFGNQIVGNYVKNSFSFGIGFKTTNFYYDLAIVKTFIGKQEYYMYNPKYVDKANIQFNLTQIVFSIGLIGNRYDEQIDYNKYQGRFDEQYDYDRNKQEPPKQIPY